MSESAQDRAADAVGTDIVVSGKVLPITQRARALFQQEQVDLLLAKAPPGCPTSVFYGFLEIAARYELDPFLGEIWLAVMAGRNGGGGRVASMVGRDGYLKVARRHEDFVDIDADVICERDEFGVDRGPNGRTVFHRYGHPKDRGPVVGAWGVLTRDGKPDRYFYAPAAEYAKDATKSAWRYLHAMMLKCPQSYLPRVTYGVSGAVPFDEVNSGLLVPSDIDGGVVESTAQPVSPPLPDRLRELVERAHAIDSQAWRVNEVAARLPNPDDATYVPTVDGLVSDVARWLDEHPVEAVQEAEVVADDVRVDRGRPVSDRRPKPKAAPAESADPFSQAMAEHDAGKSDSDEGDPRAECERRWRSDDAADVTWREQVNGLLNRRADLDAARDDLPDQQRDDVDAELRKIDADLDALGVPGGWWPTSDSADT